jgi:TetR/AcrR family transcriptional repressor of uid operon
VGDVEPDLPLEADDTADPLREQLLDAAARVFASKGYFGTKIMDIVKAAGLSSGAVYGRFASKDELLMEAVLSQVRKNAVARRFEGKTVAEILVETNRAEGPLDDAEAMQLEAFIAARREPQVAAAIADTRMRLRASITAPLVERAVADGSASPDADFDSIAYFMETLHLGLMVQRGAGQRPVDSEAWQRFLERLITTMAGSPGPGGKSGPTKRA